MAFEEENWKKVEKRNCQDHGLDSLGMYSMNQLKKKNTLNVATQVILDKSVCQMHTFMHYKYGFLYKNQCNKNVALCIQ